LRTFQDYQYQIGEEIFCHDRGIWKRGTITEFGFADGRYFAQVKTEKELLRCFIEEDEIRPITEFEAQWLKVQDEKEDDKIKMKAYICGDFFDNLCCCGMIYYCFQL